MSNAIRKHLQIASGIVMSLALTACGGSQSDVARFDDARLERLASSGDAAAIAERKRRADAIDGKLAAEKAAADAEAAKKKAGVDEAGRQAFDAALAAHDEEKINQLANDGVAAALFHRGETRLKSSDQGEHQLAYDDIEFAAEKGFPGALVWVGVRYSQGIEGYPLKPATGRDMIERAANMGSVDAMYAAGQFYDLAGYLHDIEKAKAWYKKAADKGSDAAKSRLEALKTEAPRPDETVK